MSTVVADLFRAAFSPPAKNGLPIPVEAAGGAGGHTAWNRKWAG